MDEASVCTKPAIDTVTTEEKVSPRREEQEQPQPDVEPAPAAALEVESDGEDFEWEDQSEDEESIGQFLAANREVIQFLRELEVERRRDLCSPERAKAMSVIRRMREEDAHLIRSTPSPLDEVAKPRE
ncbi:unnamed protein product [Urochloa humidicola]